MTGKLHAVTVTIRASGSIWQYLGCCVLKTVLKWYNFTVHRMQACKCHHTQKSESVLTWLAAYNFQQVNGYDTFTDKSHMENFKSVLEQ